MGWGDEVMVSGEVKRRAAGTMRRYGIQDRRGGVRPQHRWHEMWEGNPRIARPGEPFDEWLPNHGGYRPYIAHKSASAWTWRKYGPEPGEVFLAPTERAVGEGLGRKVIVHPMLKAAASPNKNWGWPNWQELVRLSPSIEWVQIGTGHEPRLEGAAFVATRSPREACGALAGARAAVLHEGGLHHAAAAVGTPAVVIFGGFISPEVTGYTAHRNLFLGDEKHPIGCGMRVLCDHCREAMRAIHPAKVLRELEAIL